ncbi:MAG: hypothetical protein HYZ10_15480 [Ignavibacteriales bacterium]|nr:hypothetical protein [Ignavibacteriales bacterium]
MLNIDDLAIGKFSLEFPKIVLSNKSGKKYLGAGNIFQDSDGDLQLKMYSYDEEGYKLFGGMGKSNLGRIIPNSYYYEFVGKDTFDQEWKADRISFGYDLSSDFKSIIIKSNIHTIKQKVKGIVKFTRTQYVIRFKKDIRFPTASYFDKNAVSYENIKNDYRINIIANFIHNDLEFLFYETEKWYIAEVFSNKGRLKENIIYYLCEALQFVLSANIYCVVIEKFEGYYNSIQIRNIRKPISSHRIPPPLSLNTAKVSDVWKMFIKYYDFVSNNKIANYHPISIKLHNLIQASSISLESQSLAITTFIESIIANEFAPYVKSIKKYASEITQLEQHLIDENYSTEFKNRINGFLPSLNNPNINNVLKELANKKLINNNHIESWKKLRHPIAHGKNIEFKHFQKYLTLCYKCQSLLNLLIFLLIGYKGTYSDFSRYGFHTTIFNKSITRSSSCPL